jgi:hypothetical protein
VTEITQISTTASLYVEVRISSVSTLEIRFQASPVKIVGQVWELGPIHPRGIPAQ